MQDFCLADIISTHILTKRMTIQRQEKQEDYLDFNSHPHEEDDQSFFIDGVVYIISTHILTKRMTGYCGEKRDQNIFQLTSSRRG